MHSPAVSGVSPCTSWKYWAMNIIIAPMSMVPNIMLPSAAPNARRANRRTSSSGSSSRHWRRTNTQPKTAPATTEAAGTACQPLRASSFRPYTRGRIAARDRPTLGRSIRPAPASRNSGRSTGPSTSSSTIAGTPSRNTDPHQKWSSMTPATSGPRAAPDMKQAIHTLIATARRRGSVNMLPIRPSVEGASVAPATPSSARAAMSIAALVE